MAEIMFAWIPLLLSADGGEEKFGLLKVDPGLIIWTLLTFGLLLLLLRKTAWGPIIAGLDRREESIRSSLDEAAKARDEGQQILEQQQAELANARQEAQKIIEQGTASAKAMQDEILAKAQADAGEVLNAARRDIQLETENARESLRGEVVDLSLEVASRVLKRSMKDEDHARFAREFMSEVDRT